MEALQCLQDSMNKLRLAGVNVYIAPAYGTVKPSTFIILENTKIENGTIKEARNNDNNQSSRTISPHDP